MPGVVGLKVLRAIGIWSLEAAGHVDAIAVGKRDDRLLQVLLAAANAAKGLGFAFAKQGVDRSHLDVEQLLDRRLDLRLRRVTRDFEDELVVFRGDRGLLRDDRS